MEEGRGPVFPNPLKGPQDPQYSHLLTASVDVRKELDYVYKAITLTRQKLEGRVPLIGFVGAPWTLLCYMVEGGGTKLFRQAKTWIYRHRNECLQLLEKIADVCVEHLAFQVVAGAQMIQVFDSWAGELAPASFAEFSLPFLRYIAQKLPERLGELGHERVPMIVFAKGAWYALDQLSESGYQVVSIDWLQDPADAVRIANGRVTLQGNADPGVLYGGRKAITQVVEKMCLGFGTQKWIVNLGHGITPGVDPDDLKWFFQEVQRCAR